MTTPRMHPKLRALLLDAFAPCGSFCDACSSMLWDPRRGHVPRGFCGATGELDEVAVILVCAEPGDPHPNESHTATTPEAMLDSAYSHTYDCLKCGTDVFHRNIRLILDLCLPHVSFDQQMRRAWITDSVLCSARRECGSVPAKASQACRARYLEAQLALMPQAIVAAVGRKAHDRMRGISNVVSTGAAAPPGCNRPAARESWERLAHAVRGLHDS